MLRICRRFRNLKLSDKLSGSVEIYTGLWLECPKFTDINKYKNVLCSTFLQFHGIYVCMNASILVNINGRIGKFSINLYVYHMHI